MQIVAFVKRGICRPGHNWRKASPVGPQSSCDRSRDVFVAPGAEPGLAWCQVWRPEYAHARDLKPHVAAGQPGLEKRHAIEATWHMATCAVHYRGKVGTPVCQAPGVLTFCFGCQSRAGDQCEYADPYRGSSNCRASWDGTSDRRCLRGQ